MLSLLMNVPRDRYPYNYKLIVNKIENELVYRSVFEGFFQ